LLFACVLVETGQPTRAVNIFEQREENSRILCDEISIICTVGLGFQINGKAAPFVACPLGLGFGGLDGSGFFGRGRVDEGGLDFVMFPDKKYNVNDLSAKPYVLCSTSPR
jgi:hypothetical protein